MSINLDLDVEIRAKASSGVDEALVLRRLQALGTMEQTDKVTTERNYLRKLLKRLRR